MLYLEFGNVLQRNQHGNDMSTDNLGNADDNMGNAQDVVISVAMLVVMAT